MNKKVKRLLKPQAPTKADYVRGDAEIINKKLQSVANYRAEAFGILKEHFGTDDAEELVMILAEKYHPPIKRYHQQGRKLKWTPQIEAMLAVLIDSRNEDKNPPTVEDEIDWLLSFKCWNDFLQKNNIEESSNPSETLRKKRLSGLKRSEYMVELNLYKEDRKAWISRMVKILKG